jgi:hypothetical protein
MVCNAEPVVVNHGVIHSYLRSSAQHDSQPLAQHNKPCFTMTGLLIMDYVVPKVVNQGVAY